MHCWGIDIEAMNSKQGCFFCNSDIPCYLNVEYDEMISCWNPFQNLLT